MAGIVDEWAHERKARTQQDPDEHNQPVEGSARAQHGDPSEFTCPECGGTRLRLEPIGVGPDAISTPRTGRLADGLPARPSPRVVSLFEVAQLAEARLE